MAFDLHKNFAYSLIAVAPTPAASGTTFSVTAADGAKFPAVAFNAVIWPAGANPSTTNAEIVRVTSKGTGDDWTVTRTQESSSARAIAVGDQIAAAITVKIVTDIEARVVTAEATIVTNTASIVTTDALAAKGRVPGGRLTLTTALPVTTADVTAATTLYYALHTHNVISLYSGTAWVDRAFAELSIAVPATTSQMYDVFVYDNAGVATLELLAWTNDTTRATALVRQDGHWVKTGATTRLYVGSFRTTGVSGQTEDSVLKRYVWNMYNRVPRYMARIETTASYAYTLAVWRQVNASAANQLDFIVGLNESPVRVEAIHFADNTNVSIPVATGIGLDSTSALVAGYIGLGVTLTTVNITQPMTAMWTGYSGIGRHFLAWLEYSTATGATTWRSASSNIIGSGGIRAVYEG